MYVEKYIEKYVEKYWKQHQALFIEEIKPFISSINKTFLLKPISQRLLWKTTA